MGLAIPIETSARHIHLCREDFEILFGEGKELTFKSELSQPGQFACEERLEVRGPKGAFERVAVLGPFRGETQVEISMTDSRKLGIPGMIRQSGDTAGTQKNLLRLCSPPLPSHTATHTHLLSLYILHLIRYSVKSAQSLT